MSNETLPGVTPAIARAAEENPNAYRDWNDAFMSGQPIEPASVYVSRRTLTAALTDPDDPDSLARTLFVIDAGYVLGVRAVVAENMWSAVGAADTRIHWRAVADGLRMMLTGSGAST